MARFAFCGGTYESQSPAADAERTQNWYPETVESGNGKSATALYPTPGSRVFSNLGAVTRGGIFINGRLFAVGGSTLYEIFADTSKVARGLNLANDGNLCSLAVSQTQLLVASGGSLYVLNLQTNAFSQVTVDVNDSPLPSIQSVDYSDGFFLALEQQSQTFFVSAAENATSWDLGQFAEISIFPDNVAAMKVSHREPIFFGSKRLVAYYDAGALFPFSPVIGSDQDHGAASPNAVAALNNTLFWISNDDNGARMAWTAQGYTPTRISTHAEEYAWSKYATISDVVTYAYQDQGHSFFVVYFPSAMPSTGAGYGRKTYGGPIPYGGGEPSVGPSVPTSATWVYDVENGLWHQRTFLQQSGVCSAHRSWWHVYAFGKHLVGDWGTGNIYQISIDAFDDFGNPIQRVRRAPYINTENEWMIFRQFELELETGLGPQPPLGTGGYGGPSYGGPLPYGGAGSGVARPPMLSLRWSDDRGHSWSNYHLASAGFAGDYKLRAIWRRLGRSRGRVFEVSTSDPIPWRLIDAYVKAEPGYQAADRLSNMLRKVG